MKEFAKDRMRLEHIVEAIERLQVHAGNLAEDELRKDVMRYSTIDWIQWESQQDIMFN